MKKTRVDETAWNIGAYGGYTTFWRLVTTTSAGGIHCPLRFSPEMGLTSGRCSSTSGKWAGHPGNRQRELHEVSWSKAPTNLLSSGIRPYLFMAQRFHIPTPRNGGIQQHKMLGVPFLPDETHWRLKPQNGILWQREFKGWLDRWLKSKKIQLNILKNGSKK